MPLTRATVTTASRIMLPTYPAFFTAVGLSLLLTSQTRLRDTPAFDYADQLVDLRVWGAGFSAIALVLVAALVTHHRRTYQVALSVAVVWMALWAVVALGSAILGKATFSAWSWPAFIACACFASLASLESRET